MKPDIVHTRLFRRAPVEDVSLYEFLKRLSVATRVATEGKNDHDWALRALDAMNVVSPEAEMVELQRRHQ